MSLADDEKKLTFGPNTTIESIRILESKPYTKLSVVDTTCEGLHGHGHLFGTHLLLQVTNMEIIKLMSLEAHLEERNDKQGFQKESFQEHLEYSVLEFTDCPEVGQDEFQESITSINEGVESLIIKDTLWINDDILELFTAFCHKIKSLRLEGIFPHVTRLGIESVGRNCSNLESLSVISSQSNNKNDGGGNKDAENCEILRWNLDNQIFTALVNSSSAKLKSFTLCGFNTFTSDRLLSLLNHFKDTLVMLDFSCLTCIENNALKELGKICPNIVCLRLNQCKGVQDEGLISLSSTCRCLENLELQGCCRITDDSIVALTRNCVSLTQINLKGCTLLTDISLRAIARNCKRLSHVNMSETRVEKVPNDIGRLDNLTSLNLSDCKELVYPSPNIISNGVDAIRLKLLESDISRRVRVFFIGNQQSGKTSIILSLESTSASVADGETFGIPVTTWFPFRHVSSDVPNVLLKSMNRDVSAAEKDLSLELWDCSGRKALQGIHPLFMGPQSLYVIMFNISLYNNADKIPQWINMIQAKTPGATIILVASHADLVEDEESIKEECSKLLSRLNDMEEKQLEEIREKVELMSELEGSDKFLQAEKKRFQMMLDRRPKILRNILVVSSIKQEGIDSFRRILVEAALDSNVFPPYTLHKDSQTIFSEIVQLREKATIMQESSALRELIKNHGIQTEDDINAIIADLSQLGCITSFNFPLPLALQHEDMVCIDPPSLAHAMASIHRNEDNPQDLVNELQRGGHLETFWPNAKPNDWTLRGAFSNITNNGMVRETIIPLLLYNWNLDDKQAELVIKAMELLSILVSGAPNASYDVELILTNYKNLSVYKRYFLPFQGKLPVIPQVNAWLPQCPDTHIQIGWSFRFAKPISQHLFTYLISASTCARKSSETLSYWKCGTYLRVGEVNIAVMKSKDELSLEVKARSKIVKGTRQALNLGWCVLSRYLYVIQMILNTFPGLYFEIQVEDLEAVMWKPLEEIVDSYIKRDLIADEAILYMPVTALKEDDNATNPNVSPDLCHWLNTVASQSLMYIHYDADHTNEVRCLIYYLESAGYVCTCEGDVIEEHRKECVEKSSVILFILTKRYIEEGNFKLLQVAANTSKKIIVAQLDALDDINNPGLKELLEGRPRVDISEGTGSGTSYQVNKNQIKSLTETCHSTVFGIGDLITEYEDDRGGNSINGGPKPGNITSPKLKKKRSVQFADQGGIQVEPMDEETEVRRVAASAVAAAVASATAEHIAKQSNPTMGAKAAAMAAKVADAVARGDSDAAAKAVIATAKAVDEVVAVASLRTSVTRTNGSAVSNTSNGNRSQTSPKSAMCSIL